MPLVYWILNWEVIDMTVLPPTCNCDGIKTIDTPCPIHGGAHRLPKQPPRWKPSVTSEIRYYEKKVEAILYSFNNTISKGG